MEDAVGAIIAAMQSKSVNDSPTTFNIGSGELSNLAVLADEIQDLVMPDCEYEKKNIIDVDQSGVAYASSLVSHYYLCWSAKTAFKDRSPKQLAWHLDRAMSVFRPVSSSDNEVDHSTSQRTAA